MTIRTNCTNDRKVMVKKIAEHLGVESNYLGTPSCGYRIGELTVDREAVIAGEPELLLQIAPLLLEEGYISEMTQSLVDFKAESTSTEAENIPTDQSTVFETVEAEAPAEDIMELTDEHIAEQSEAVADTDDDAHDAYDAYDENDAHDADASEPSSNDDPGNRESDCEAFSLAETDADSEADGKEIKQMYLSIPLSTFTPNALVNTMKLICARQTLIAAMLQSDSLYVADEVTDLLRDGEYETIEQICELLKSETEAEMIRGIKIENGSFTLMCPYDAEDPTRWGHYSKLLNAIIDCAGKAHHINSKCIGPLEDEMKYFCRNWLIQLGLSGANHKDTQRVLLGHLKGYAAFRTAEKMNAHKAKYAELRRELREDRENESN